MSRVSTLSNYDLEKAELRRVLASRLFSRAPTLSKMLTYICEKHFVGQVEHIKEYNIAVEALGRGPEFDTGGDSIVRVQAARLRKHLERYYLTEGAGSTLQLRIADVGYTPRFVPVAAPEPGDAPRSFSESIEVQPALPPEVLGPRETASPDRPRSSRRAFAGAVAVAGCAAGIFAFTRFRTAPASKAALSRVQAPAPDLRELRIHVGSSVSRRLDTSGESWLNDSYVTGGTVFSRPDRQIIRTFDQSLYQTGREGDFQYAIPLKRGTYELHLHFAETSYGQNRINGAEKLRMFDVSMNGAPLLTSFDIAGDAGGANVADEKIFKDVSPAADGLLRLGFATRRNGASLNGIEVLPGLPGKALPIRILCGPRAYYDQQGRLWKSDRYVYGGRQDEALSPVRGTEDQGIYSYNRWGNFNYAIPVADGTYRLTLRFAEPVWRSGISAGGRGRAFDVYCNGRVLASRLDIFEQAGGDNRALVLTYRGLKPNAQGKLELSFVPVVDYAILCALEVEDEAL